MRSIWSRGIAKCRQALLVAVAVLMSAGFNLVMAVPGSLFDQVARAEGAGQITGVVAQNDGTPIAGATIKAFVSAQAYYTGQFAAATSSAGDGTYTLSNLADGNYIVLFNDYSDSNSNHAWSWNFYDYSNKIPEQANQVAVTNGGTTGDINGHLLPAGQISGTVTNKQGTPLAGIKVGAYGTTQANGGTQELPITATTASDGTYTLWGMAAGVYDYYVLFNMTNVDHYVQLWYNDTIDPGQAAGITITAGQTHSGIDAHLFETGQSPAASLTSPAAD